MPEWDLWELSARPLCLIGLLLAASGARADALDDADAARRKGDCVRAAEGYRAYLATARADDPRAKVAHTGLGECRARQAITARQEALDPPTPWYRDTLGHTAVLGGVLVIGAGVYVWNDGREAILAQRNALTYGEAWHRKSTAKTDLLKQRLGVAGGVLGAALITVGLVRYGQRWCVEASPTSVSLRRSF